MNTITTLFWTSFKVKALQRFPTHLFQRGFDCHRQTERFLTFRLVHEPTCFWRKCRRWTCSPAATNRHSACEQQTTDTQLICGATTDSESREWVQIAIYRPINRDRRVGDHCSPATHSLPHLRCKETSKTYWICCCTRNSWRSVCREGWAASGRPDLERYV